MKRLLVGVDGSGVAADALQWAGRLAARSDAEVIALHAFTPPFAEMTPEIHDELVEERRGTLARWTAPLRESGVRVNAVVRSGDPRDLVDQASRHDSVDLVVLGRTGEGGGPGFLHLGSVAEHVAHHTSVPLAVIPAGASTATDTVVLGVDGSPGSRAAVRWTAQLLDGRDAKVVVVQVVPGPTVSADWEYEAQQRLDAHVGPLRDAGVEFEPLVMREVHPADALSNLADERGADLVVIGTRGLGGFSGLRAGGVALKVLHRIERPLVLVPAD